MAIRELTWQIKQVVLEAQNFTSILPSLRIFRLKTYEISDLGQLRTRLGTKLRRTLRHLHERSDSAAFIESIVIDRSGPE